MNGSVASLSGLLQLPFGAEKPELPQEETDESEKPEQTEVERWKLGFFWYRLSVMRDHSDTGLSCCENGGSLGAGV